MSFLFSVGHNIPSLCHQFIMSDASVNRILSETMEAIISNLSEEYLSVS